MPKEWKLQDMNLYIDYKLNDSGKGKFLKRLIPELKNLGIKTKFYPTGCDVALGISKWRGKLPRMPRVLRLDGIHLTGENEHIVASIKNSHALIYQSYFAKNFIKKRLKIHKKNEYVIYNGANPEDYEKGLQRKSCFMAANWGHRHHKRLDLHLKYAAEHKDKQFYLAGKCPAKDTSNLKVLGQLSESAMRDWLSACKTFVYLADLDWCPNVFIEAKVAGVKHMVINPECKAVEELTRVEAQELYISNIAKQYKKVLYATAK